MLIQAGDRVKLTPTVARTFMANKRHRANWFLRRGTVCHTSGYSASVLWDNLHAPDQRPLAALESGGTLPVDPRDPQVARRYSALARKN
jgi:hypothetical protein